MTEQHKCLPWPSTRRFYQATAAESEPGMIHFILMEKALSNQLTGWLDLAEYVGCASGKAANIFLIREQTLETAFLKQVTLMCRGGRRKVSNQVTYFCHCCLNKEARGCTRGLWRSCKTGKSHHLLYVGTRVTFSLCTTDLNVETKPSPRIYGKFASVKTPVAPFPIFQVISYLASGCGTG